MYLCSALWWDCFAALRMWACQTTSVAYTRRVTHVGADTCVFTSWLVDVDVKLAWEHNSERSFKAGMMNCYREFPSVCLMLLTYVLARAWICDVANPSACLMFRGWWFGGHLGCDLHLL